MKKGQAQSVIVSFFLAVMVALIMVTTAGDFVTNQQSIVATSDTNVAVTSNASLSFTQLTFADLVPSSELINISNGTALIRNTNYVMDYDAGRVNITSGMSDGNSSLGNDDLINVSYAYFPASYIKNNTTRTLIFIIPVVIIIILILFVTAQFNKP